MRAKGRKLDDYSERHHILPRCMGGSNAKDNMVRLLPEEHYVAHQLLVKIYPHKKGLALAAHRMAKQCTGRKSYGWLRRRMSEERKGARLSPAAFAKVLAYARSPEGRAHAAAKQTGKKYSAESRLKMSIAKRGKKRSPEAIAKSAAGNRGKTISVEHRLRISMANAGKRLSQEQFAKRTAARRANRIHRNGKW